MNTDDLFLNALKDLHVCIHAESEYEVIQSSKILRQLLLDGDKLVFAVNKTRKLPIRFHVAKIEMPPDFVVKEGTWAIIADLYPPKGGNPGQLLKINEFLAVVVGGSRGELITIHDVIKFAVINLGGVHFKQSISDEDKKLVDLSTRFFLNAESPLYMVLRVIGRIVLEAMLPLRNAIVSRSGFEGADGFTCILLLNLYPGQPDEDNYIFDCGSDESKNRLSLYVDQRSELTFRIIDKNSVRNHVRAGLVGLAIPYGIPQVIVCEIAKRDGRILVSVETNSWDHTEVYLTQQLDPDINVEHLVVGSDCKGKKETHMMLLGKLVISKALSKREKDQAIEYFRGGLKKGSGGVYFQGNKFLHSQKHPNFNVQ